MVWNCSWNHQKTTMHDDLSMAANPSLLAVTPLIKWFYLALINVTEFYISTVVKTLVWLAYFLERQSRFNRFYDIDMANAMHIFKLYTSLTSVPVAIGHDVMLTNPICS